MKGVEFQHVLIWLSQDTFDLLKAPFQGKGNPVYDRLRLLRIPFSRARDSLTLVIIPNQRHVA
jgi:hypothetical protein